MSKRFNRCGVEWFPPPPEALIVYYGIMGSWYSVGQQVVNDTRCRGADIDGLTDEPIMMIISRIKYA